MKRQSQFQRLVLIVTILKAPTIDGKVSLQQVKSIYNKYKARSRAEATYYGAYPGGNACSLDPLSPLAKQLGLMRTAAGSTHIYQNSLGCGMCLDVRGTGKGKGNTPIRGTKKVIVHDRCLVGLDLFVKGNGRWEINYIEIPCPTLPDKAGKIQFRFEGSNP